MSVAQAEKVEERVEGIVASGTDVVHPVVYLDISTKEFDCCKVEWETSGDVYGSVLGEGKYVLIHPLLSIPLPKLINESAVPVLSFRKIILQFKDGGEKVLKIPEPPVFYLFKGKYEYNEKKRKKVLRLTGGGVKLVLTYWRKGETKPSTVDLMEIELKSVGKLLLPSSTIFVKIKKDIIREYVTEKDIEEFVARRSNIVKEGNEYYKVERHKIRRPIIGDVVIEKRRKINEDDVVEVLAGERATEIRSEIFNSLKSKPINKNWGLHVRFDIINVVKKLKKLSKEIAKLEKRKRGLDSKGEKALRKKIRKWKKYAELCERGVKYIVTFYVPRVRDGFRETDIVRQKVPKGLGIEYTVRLNNIEIVETARTHVKILLDDLIECGSVVYDRGLMMIFPPDVNLNLKGKGIIFDCKVKKEDQGGKEVEVQVWKTFRKVKKGRRVRKYIPVKIRYFKCRADKFGHQTFEIKNWKEIKDLDESKMEKAEELELEWISGMKLHHKVESSKEFMWRKEVMEINGVKAVKYYIIFGKDKGGTLVVHNTQHKDIGKDRIRCHLRSGEILIITHFDPNLKDLSL